MNDKVIEMRGLSEPVFEAKRINESVLESIEESSHAYFVVVVKCNF